MTRASIFGCTRLSVSPGDDALRIEIELQCKALDQLIQLLQRDLFAWRDDPVPHAILPSEPQCIIARILQVREIATKQHHFVVIFAVADMRQRSLQGWPTRPDSFRFDDHLQPSRWRRVMARKVSAASFTAAETPTASLPAIAASESRWFAIVRR